jgi:hypothetical protein
VLLVFVLSPLAWLQKLKGPVPPALKKRGLTVSPVPLLVSKLRAQCVSVILLALTLDVGNVLKNWPIIISVTTFLGAAPLRVGSTSTNSHSTGSTSHATSAGSYAASATYYATISSASSCAASASAYAGWADAA